MYYDHAMLLIFQWFYYVCDGLKVKSGLINNNNKDSNSLIINKQNQIVYTTI